jgi:hypothetical protein
MKVYRVSNPEEAQKAYPCATEAPIPTWADGLSLARAWFAKNLGERIEGFHLEDDLGEVIGHIYWAPSERALVPYRLEGGAAYIHCEWVQRQHVGKGYMHRLFGAFVGFLCEQNYKGILVDGTEIEGYMHLRHFARRGFRTLRESNGGRLMYLPLRQEVVKAEPITPRIAKEGTAPVEVLIIGSHACPVGTSTVLSLRKVAGELSGQVVMKEVPAGAEALACYGVADGIFINTRPKFFGPVTEEQVRRAIQAEIPAA